jgi:uncharacterized protein HemX
MKKPEIIIMTLIIMFSLILGACGGGADKVRQEQLNERKESTAGNLNDILHDIEERIEIAEYQMEKAEGELQEELEELNSALKEQKENIENELKLVNEATIETWNDVIDNTSETIREVRSKTNEITKKLRDLMEE